MKKIFQSLFFTHLLYFISADFPPSCMKMLNKNLFLYECCEYPVIPHDSSIYEKCLRECSTFDYCCYQECSAKEIGIYSHEGMNVEKVNEVFELQKGLGNFVKLSENWKKIVNGSVDKCCVTPRSPDQKTCEYIYEVVACIFKENFINCPNMADKSACMEVKNEMNECAKSEGAWRFITDAFNTVRPRTYSRRYAESLTENVSE